MGKRLNRVLDVVDPLRILGVEPPVELSKNIMESLRGERGVHEGIYWAYASVGHQIIAISKLRDNVIFYDGCGKRAFS